MRYVDSGTVNARKNKKYQSRSDAKQSDGAEGIEHALFDMSEVEKLPPKDKVLQPAKNWEELETKGKEALIEFKKILGGVADKLDLVQGKKPQSYDNAIETEKSKANEEKRKPLDLNGDEYMLPQDWGNDKGFLFMGPLKGKDRAAEKVAADYDGNWGLVKDMVRATIAVPMVTQIPQVLKQIKAAGLELAQQPKNNLVKPLPGGYRDLNLIVKLPDGFLAELQIHIKPMTLAKEKGQ